MKMQLLVLAGGIASRIHLLSQHTPKVLLPINGKPFVNYQLEIFKIHNFFSITFCLGHLGSIVEQYVNDINTSNFENRFKVSFSHDGEFRLGTGGAISKALSTFSGNFMVTYGDSYLTEDLQGFIRKFMENNCLTQIAVTRNVRTNKHLNVKIEGRSILDFLRELPGGTHSEYGFSIINRERFVKYVNERERKGQPQTFDLIDFFEYELHDGQLNYVETQLPFWEIGSYTGIQKLTELLKEV